MTTVSVKDKCLILFHSNTKLRDQFLFSGDSLFCMDKGDSRFQPMCCHYLSDLPCDADIQLGAQECQSPFGTYEFSIPIDKELACDSSTVTDQNCKDFDVRVFKSCTFIK